MSFLVLSRGVDPRRKADVSGPSLTKQAMKDECDVNMILKRFTKTGMLTHIAKGQPIYADVSDVGSYREAVDRVRAAEDFFMRLPSKVRAYFDNSVERYLDEAGTLSPEELKNLGIEILERPAVAVADGPAEATSPEA